MRTLGLIGPMNEREAIEFERRFVAPATTLAPPEVVGTFADTEPAPPPSEPPPSIEIPRVGLVRELAAPLYHADPCDRPSLSSSIAKVLTQQSPAHAWARHPRLGRKSSGPSSVAMNEGQVFHALALGQLDELEIVHARDYKSQAARNERDAVIARGRTPVLAEDYERLSWIVDEQLAPFLQEWFPPGGQAEVSVFWEELEHEIPVQCRGRLDYLLDDGRGPVLVRDLKTTRSARPEDIARAIDDYGYAIQQIAYERAIRAVKRVNCAIDYVLLFVELEPPYAVTPVRLSEAWRTIGGRRWGRAVETWERCTRTETWPAYSSGEVVTVTAPSWTLRAEGLALDEVA